MKRLYLLVLALAASFMLQAQWVDNPQSNTFLANTSADAGEIYAATTPDGHTYFQWAQMRSNGWAPVLQCVDFEGNPQWGEGGIPINVDNLATWSPGYAMAATSDGSVVSVFRTADAQHYAVRINPDGTFPWGEDGIMLFDGLGGDRSEVMAGNDGGVWATGTDYDYTYLQYVHADGTLGPVITMGDGEHQYMFGLMVPTIDNSVLVAFEKESWAYTYYYEKELWVVGYTTDGVQIGPEVQLMNPFTMGGSYCHYVVPDGLNGGYAYMWHPGLGDAFNTYVFHFDEYGNSTIADLNGVAVHSTDPANYYLDAYGTVDPTTHDLIIAYQVKDSYTQSQDHIYMNRITSTGEKVWGEGILVADYTGADYSGIKVDAFEDGNGFVIIYLQDNVVMAKGYDKDGNLLWSKTMSMTNYNKTFCKASTGFHMGQNVVAWVNSSNSGLYGQNIGPDGTMGYIEPVIPEPECLAPENLEGEYVFDMEAQLFGVQVSWTAPETQPLHYNLYRYDGLAKDFLLIEVPGDVTTYFDETELGTYTYQLTAVYDDCESDFALTPDGEDHIDINVTGVEEDADQPIVTLLNVYNMKGQRLKVTDVNALPTGVYILQGLTQDGRMVTRKTVVNPQL